jgi:hypothetical protein
MSRYLLTLGITVLVIGVLSAGALIRLAWPFGAFATPAQLAELQHKNNCSVVLPFDLRYYAAFKLARVEEEQPEVIYFSSSRAGTMRASMFKPYRFYNMSFTAWTTDQLADVFERVTRTVHPRIAIVELDYFLFTDSWEKAYADNRSMIYDRPLHYVKASVGNFIRSAAQYPYEFQKFWRSPSSFLGPQAILTRSGFRNDGSHVFPPGYIEYARSHLQNAKDFIAGMPGASSMSQHQKASITQLSEIARQRGIKLIALQLPLVRDAIDYLDHNEAFRDYSGVWREFESDETKTWLRGLGIKFFDLAHSPIDEDPYNFIDASHPSEIGMLNVIRELLKNPEFRVDFQEIDPVEIEGQLKGPMPMCWSAP